MAEYNAKRETSTENIFAHFGVSKSKSIDTINVESPIGSIKFQIIEANTPFLSCLQEMDRLGVYLNNTTDRIEKYNKYIPTFRIFGHPFRVWGRESMNNLSEIEPRQLLRRFGHPSLNRLILTFERARQ